MIRSDLFAASAALDQTVGQSDRSFGHDEKMVGLKPRTMRRGALDELAKIVWGRGH